MERREWSVKFSYKEELEGERKRKGVGIDHPMQRRTCGACIIKGWEDK